MRCSHGPFARVFGSFVSALAGVTAGSAGARSRSIAAMATRRSHTLRSSAPRAVSTSAASSLLNLADMTSSRASGLFFLGTISVYT